MKVPKEIAAKIREYQRCREKAGRLFEELEKYFTELADDGQYYDDFFIADEPTGYKQEDDGTEYCNQSSGYSGDDFSGTYYYQIEGSRKYAAYNYTC